MNRLTLSKTTGCFLGGLLISVCFSIEAEEIPQDMTTRLQETFGTAGFLQDSAYYYIQSDGHFPTVTGLE